MAIDQMVQENPTSTPSISPRISLSHYLFQKNDYPFCNYNTNLNSDFDFCFATHQDPADELFSNGFIFPFQENIVANLKESSEGEGLLPGSADVGLKQKPQPLGSQSKPLWGIKRSSSLDCRKKGSFWSLSLLSRSNSTGSVGNSKATGKEGLKQSGGQFRHIKKSVSASSFSSQKPPLRKNYGNGVRINPVINVTPPINCIPVATTNLFGLGSLFRNRKDKKSIKK